MRSKEDEIDRLNRRVAEREAKLRDYRDNLWYERDRAEAAEARCDELQELLDQANSDHARVAAERDAVREVVNAALARCDELSEAVDKADYYLRPNQGESPSPSKASYWLRTTLPENDPDYLTPEQAANFCAR